MTSPASTSSSRTVDLPGGVPLTIAEFGTNSEGSRDQDCRNHTAAEK